MLPIAVRLARKEISPHICLFKSDRQFSFIYSPSYFVTLRVNPCFKQQEKTRSHFRDYVFLLNADCFDFFWSLITSKSVQTYVLWYTIPSPGSPGTLCTSGQGLHGSPGSGLVEHCYRAPCGLLNIMAFFFSYVNVNKIKHISYDVATPLSITVYANYKALLYHPVMTKSGETFSI